MEPTQVDLASAMQHSPIGMGIVSPTGGWLAVNPALARIVGYTRDELLARDFQSITHPDDLESDLESVRRILAGEIDRYDMEKRYVHKDGHIVWVEIHVNLVWNPDATPRHFIAQILDITERKNTADALRASRAKLLLGMQFALIGYWEYDVATDRFAFDEDIMRLYRTTKLAEVDQWSIGSYIREFVVPEDGQRVWNAIQTAIASTHPNYASHLEHRVIRRDGTRGYVRARFSVVRDESGVVKLIGANQDTSEWRQAEHGLRQSEQRLRQLTENLREVVWMSTIEKDQMLYVSPAYEQIWGRSCASLYAAPWSWLEAIHPEDRERVAAGAASDQLTGAYDLEYRVIRPDGEIRWINDRAFPVRDENGAVYRLAGVADDITERKRIEERSRQAQKMEAIGQLAGGIAHDFNNILSVIMMEVDEALNQPELAVASIREISAAAERAANLTRQLLQFSRKQTMHARKLDLNESVTNLARMLKRVIPETIQIRLGLGEPPTHTMADPGMIDQVIMNLAVNARDAMPSGGRFVIETRSQDVTEDMARAIPDATPGKYVTLRVTDEGCGIAAEDLARIFEPFFTTKEPTRGTGLGLATVFGIVKQHHGWITVSSRVGRGTTFEVFLPAVVEASHRESTHAQTQPIARGGTETILLVEDDAVLRRMICGLLRRNGYHVLDARSSVEALAIWDSTSRPIHLLFTDLVMPDGVSGRELAEELLRRSPDLKVILTSGYSVDLLGRPLEVKGGPDFLSKPWPPRKLLDTVRGCLDGEG